ncbi:MAG: GH32 C-terminal domain-containing protein [Dysgonomonas sp.]
MKKILVSLLLLNIFSLSSFAENEQYLIAHFPMELTGNTMKENVSGKSFVVQNNFGKPENIPGAEGLALRCDGYSTFSDSEINNALGSNLSEFTATLWCAMETYPMTNVDTYDAKMTYIAGNMNDDQKSGFAFVLNSYGTYGVEIYIGGTKRKCYATLEKLPKYEWAQLSVTIKDGKINLYRNGILSGKTTFAATNFNIGNKEFVIGKSFANDFHGVFRLGVINGLIDDIRIYSKALDVSQFGNLTPENVADLSIPASRHAGDIQRPVYHPIPATNWTNETHGLVYYNNKYHVYFQKNANGPYMLRLHWGHLSSPDLINWTEEHIAIAPGDAYDIKGAWSGCLFSDAEMTGGKPNIFYTSVDYGKASISQAMPLDENLVTWEKSEQNPVIPNRPPGLGDDFRDPYIFEHENNIYMVVGTSKDGHGATTLHRYDRNTKTWSNDGSIFYRGTDAAYGTFWEMPAVVKMNGGRWMLVVTNLGSPAGTEAIYWVGTINADGTFNAYNNVPKKIELFSGHGYGLLSPSVMYHDDKVITLGIVPDKLPGEQNLRMGWAHLYSLPREWSLDLSNTLVQKPYSGLTKIRSNTEKYAVSNTSVINAIPINEVTGKAVEINTQFKISSANKIGFTVRKSGQNGVQVYYEPATNKIVVDARSITRLWNDAGLYNGLYETVLPENMNAGDIMNLQIYIDHSIMDIFVNNKYAFSIRVFPTDNNSDQIEVFSEGSTTQFDYLNIWKLDPSLNNPNGIENERNDDSSDAVVTSTSQGIIYKDVPSNSHIYVYDGLGRCLLSMVNREEAGILPLEIVDRQFYIVKIVGENIQLSRKLLTK